MTINLPGHPMSVTQHYLAMNGTHLFGLSTHLHHFQVIECDLYIESHIAYDCMCVVLVNSVLLREEPSKTHTHAFAPPVPLMGISRINSQCICVKMTVNCFTLIRFAIQAAL